MTARSILPSPIAAIARRAWNAKAARERHDLAVWAWEASVRIGVACNPPADATRLERGTLGHWVRAFQVEASDTSDAKLLAAFRLFRSASMEVVGRRSTISIRELVDALPAYRNKTMGHGPPRNADDYSGVIDTLLEGLDAAWEAHVFIPSGSRLVYVQAIEIAPSRTVIARLLALEGDANKVIDPEGTPVSQDLLAGRIYLLHGERFTSLHPWLLYRDVDARERVLFFNGRGRTPSYLDFATGETLASAALAAAFPSLEAEVNAVMRGPSGARPATPEPADGTFDGYRIIRPLGRGSTGHVHLAEQVGLARRVAVKILSPTLVGDHVAVARFKREVSALARCEHANVARVLGYGQAQGTWYYAMEYVDGVDLSRLREELSAAFDLGTAISSAAAHASSENQKTSPDTQASSMSGKAARPPGSSMLRSLASLFRDAARGLQHLHENRIVHRDVKPANIMVTVGDQRAVIVDLGLAVLDGAHSVTADQAMLAGTLRYVAPEQLQSGVSAADHRLDIYALGASVYEVMTGRPMFDGDTPARLIQQILGGDCVPARAANRAIPSDLAAIIGKATARVPSRRYETAGALADDLDHFLRDEPVLARAPTVSYLAPLAVRRHVRRHSALWIAIAAAVVGITVTAFIMLRLSSGEVSVTIESDREGDLVFAAPIDLATGLRGERVAFGSTPLPAKPVSPGMWRFIVYREGVGWSELTRVLPEDGAIVRSPSIRSTGGIVSEMALIEEGDYTVGFDRAGDDLRHLKTHAVHLEAFWIDKYEVSNRDYQEFLEKNPGRQEPSTWRDIGSDGLEDLPVIGITFEDARAYAEWAGKRLPTRWEWEVAARDGDSRDYPWGNDARDLAKRACVGRASRDPPWDRYKECVFPVRAIVKEGDVLEDCTQKGVMHMFGNVREWTESFAVTWTGGIPHGSATSREVRGLSWNEFVDKADTLVNHGDEPITSRWSGFRCVKSLIVR